MYSRDQREMEMLEKLALRHEMSGPGKLLREYSIGGKKFFLLGWRRSKGKLPKKKPP